LHEEPGIQDLDTQYFVTVSDCRKVIDY